MQASECNVEHRSPPHPLGSPLPGAGSRYFIKARRTTGPVAEKGHAPEEQLRILGEVGSMFLHDIRNLLSVMACSAESACKTVPATSAATLLPIQSAISTAADLTQSLGCLLKGQHNPTPGTATVTPHKRLENLLPLLRSAAGGATLRCYLQGTNNLTVAASPAAFDSSILNIIINARHALLTGRTVAPEILLTTRTFTVRRPDGQSKRLMDIRVADNGPGMSAETLARITEPFFTTKGERGSGLGLYQVRRFCEAAEGRLIIRSREGLGTSVSLLLACKPEIEPLPRSAAPARKHIAGTRRKDLA